MKYFTIEDLGISLSTQVQRRTVKSDCIAGTIFEKWQINKKWIVHFMEIDSNGTLIIECAPMEYIKTQQG